MTSMHNVRFHTDARKLLLAILTVAVMITVAFTAVGIDSSDAAGEANGKAFYYDQLDDFEKQIYDGAINATVQEMTDSLGNKYYAAQYTLPIGSYAGLVWEDVKDEISAHTSKVLSKLPHEKVADVFWMAGNYYSGCTGVYSSGPNQGKIADSAELQFTVYSIYSPEEITEHKKALSDAFTSSLSYIDTSNRYQAVKTIHNYVCSNMSYYPSKPIPETMDIRNAYTALAGDHVVVCEGYAKAFKALCDKYGVPCIIVTGDGVNKDGDAEGHMWNYVQMENGKWYLVDCTWDDQSSIKYTYLLAGSESNGFYKKIKEDHVIKSERYVGFTLPTLSESALENVVVTLEIGGGREDIKISMSVGDKVSASTFAKYDPSYKDNRYNYALSGWAGLTEGMTLSTDVTFTATYDQTDRIYKVTFKDYDNSTIVVQDYKYEDVIVPPSDPTRASDEYCAYTFSEWKDYTAGQKVTTDGLVFKAVYSSTHNIIESGGDFFVKTMDNYISFDATELASIQAGSGSLTITLPRATITFDAAAVDTLEANQNLTVKMLPGDTLKKEVKDKMTKPTVFEIDFGTNNTKFAGCTVTIAINWEVRAWQHSEDLKIYYANGDTTTLIPHTYDKENEQIVFTTDHFSTYVVDVDEGLLEQAIDLVYENYIVAIIVLITLFLFVVIYRFS